MTKTIHKGQVALVMVLIMTVVSALAVSLATRSTVDTRIQQAESESVQALLLAQTGLEQLIMNPGVDTVGSPDSEYYAVRTDAGTGSVVAGLMNTGSTIEINLAEGSPSLTGFSVYWGPDSANPTNQPSVFISQVNNKGGIFDRAYGYNSGNGFLKGEVGADGYALKTLVIPLELGVIKIRITILESPAIVKVVPSGGSFPSQTVQIKSTGSVLSEGQKVKYGLQYEESTDANIPSVFDYALFSGGSISQ